MDTGARFENKPFKSQEYGNYWDESRREIPHFKKRDLDYEKMLGEYEQNEYEKKQFKEKRYKQGKIKMH